MAAYQAAVIKGVHAHFFIGHRGVEQQASFGGGEYHVIKPLTWLPAGYTADDRRVLTRCQQCIVDVHVQASLVL
ncbi:hypothetical protein D3C81_1904600 [compost metagenome]